MPSEAPFDGINPTKTTGVFGGGSHAAFAVTAVLIIFLGVECRGEKGS